MTIETTKPIQHLLASDKTLGEVREYIRAKLEETFHQLRELAATDGVSADTKTQVNVLAVVKLMAVYRDLLDTIDFYYADNLQQEETRG